MYNYLFLHCVNLIINYGLITSYIFANIFLWEHVLALKLFFVGDEKNTLLKQLFNILNNPGYQGHRSIHLVLKLNNVVKNRTD